MRSLPSLVTLFPTASIPRWYAEGGGLNHYQTAAADALQRPLRFHFQVRLTASVRLRTHNPGTHATKTVRGHHTFHAIIIWPSCTRCFPWGTLCACVAWDTREPREAGATRSDRRWDAASLPALGRLWRSRDRLVQAVCTVSRPARAGCPRVRVPIQCRWGWDARGRRLRWRDTTSRPSPRLQARPA
jgi:hypothetical protein